MSNEQMTIAAPVLDMEAIQKAANEAATKAVIKEIEEYYCGYKSPYRKQIEEYLNANAPSLHLDLPQFGELVMQSLRAEVDRITQTISASNFMQALRNSLTHQQLSEDGTLSTDKLFEDLCFGLDLDNDNPYDDEGDTIEVEIKPGSMEYWKDMDITVTKDGDECKYHVSLHKMSANECGDRGELYQILSMPYSMHDGLISRMAKIRTAEGDTIEMPTYAGVCDDEILLTIARCVMYKTPIRITKREYYRGRSEY